MKGDQNVRQPSYFRWFMDGGERGGMTCELLLAANSSRAVASRIGAQSLSLLPSSAPQGTTYFAHASCPLVGPPESPVRSCRAVLTERVAWRGGFDSTVPKGRCGEMRFW